MTQAILGTRRQVKEMVDGTLRVIVDIEPVDKPAFWALFPEIDMPVAITPLVPVPVYATAVMEAEEPKAIEAPKGGELSKHAGMLSKDPKFWAWVNEIYGSDWILAGALAASDEETAAEFIRRMCKVKSRADLDHSKTAGDWFRSEIMKKYSDWSAEKNWK